MDDTKKDGGVDRKKRWSRKALGRWAWHAEPIPRAVLFRQQQADQKKDRPVSPILVNGLCCAVAIHISGRYGQGLPEPQTDCELPEFSNRQGRLAETGGRATWRVS